MSEHDDAAQVEASTLEEVEHLFRERWLREVPESDVSAESEKVSL